MSLRERFGRLFLVASGEWVSLLSITCFNALLVGGLVVGLSVAGSLFLKRVGAEALPAMYLLSAVAVLLLAPLYFKVVDVVPRRTLLLASYLFFVLALLGMRQVLWVPGAVQVLFLLTSLITQYSTLECWLLATDLFDPRTAKRLFPLVGGGGSLGAILFGALVSPLSALVGTENLIFLSCLLLGGCLVLLPRICRHSVTGGETPEPERAEPRATGPMSVLDDLKRLREIPIMVPATAIHCLIIAMSTLIEFQYNKTAAASFRTEEGLSSFLGAVYGGVSLLATLVQFTAVGRFIAWVGIVGAMVFEPIVLALPAIIFLVSPSLLSATLTRVTDQVLQVSLYSTTSNVLYGAVPLSLRGRLSVFLKAVASPLSVAAAGVFLLIANRVLEAAWVVAAVPMLILVWMGAILGLRNRYITTLVSNLSVGDEERRLESLKALESIGQGPAVEVVRRTLRSGEEDLVLFGLELAAEIRASALEPDVSSLLAHPSAEIRRAAVPALRRVGTPVPSPVLRRHVEDPDALVRLEVMTTLEQWDPDALRQLASNRARVEEDPRVVARLVRFLGRDRGLPGDLRRRVQDMSGSQEAEVRRWAARALDGVDDEELAATLLGLLEDSNPEVRVAAIQSAATALDRRVLRYLVVGLGFAETRQVSEGGLERFGESTVEALLEAYDRHADLQGRRAMLRLLGKIGGRRAHEFMMERLVDCPDELMGELVRALCALHRGNAVDEVSRVIPSIMQSVNRAVDEALGIAVLQRSADLAAVELLIDESVRAIGAQKPLVLEKISLVAGGEMVRRLEAHLETGWASGEPSRERNIAMEVLENLLPATVRAPVAGLMDSRSWEDLVRFAERDHPMRGPIELIGHLLAHEDPWIRTCAAFAAGRLGLRQYQSSLAQLAVGTDSLLSETCLDALVRCARVDTDAKKGSPMPTTLSTMEKILFLKRVSLFQGLTARDLSIVAGRTTEVEFDRGQIIFEEGEPGDSLYILVRGSAAVMMGRTRTGHPVAILGERECVGEMAVLSGEPRTASVEAREPIRALKISREDFRALILEHPHFALSILEILIRRLRATTHLYQDVPLLEAGER